ncbi:MAG: preprotein translocase subunit YajC [Clostridia bacterium]|nr:preprotein translocase subunit YajC [Clostridia bacterium]
MANYLFAFLDAAATTGDGTEGSIIPTLIMIVAMIAIFYFLMYRPQKKQEKEAAKMRNELMVGDEITTIGGIIGEIVSIKENTVMIETGKDRTKIRILTTAIRNVDVHATEKQAAAQSIAEEKEKSEEK